MQNLFRIEIRNNLFRKRKLNKIYGAKYEKFENKKFS